MKTKIEVVIGLGQTRPTIKKVGGKWTITAESETCAAYGRGVWVRTFKPLQDEVIDSDGFLVSPNGKLSKG